MNIIDPKIFSQSITKMTTDMSISFETISSSGSKENRARSACQNLFKTLQLVYFRETAYSLFNFVVNRFNQKSYSGLKINISDRDLHVHEGLYGIASDYSKEH